VPSVSPQAILGFGALRRREDERVSYTGDVVVGGPTQVRVLDEIEIRKVAVGPMDNNAYLLTCRRDGAQLLVDPADEPARLLDLVREGSASARLDDVVVTHRHADHHRALASVVAVTGADVSAGAPDADAIAATTGVPVDRRLHDGDTVSVGHLTIEVIALAGHTPGSVALVYREPAHADVPGRAHLFTGDSLFPGGVGHTHGDASMFAQLYDDVVTRVFDRFDDDAWVYPGHGRDTTLGAERPHLHEWLERGW
jgi:glyoxylase-like metal-dependent hydrolase (beta-lactamase superfamily II)